MLATVINRILSRLRELGSSQMGKTHLPPDCLLQRTYRIKKKNREDNKFNRSGLKIKLNNTTIKSHLRLDYKMRGCYR